MNLALFLINNAHATTMVPLTLNQLVDASDHIVKGVVTEVWTEPDTETGFIWTYAQVEIEKSLKGEDNDVIILEQPGGKWGSQESYIEGSARFSVGETGYFFVEVLRSGRQVSVGMFQGKYNVIMDPYQRTHIAVRFPVDQPKTFNHRFIPLPPKKLRTTTADFELSITNRVESGWDGKAIPGTSSERLQRISPSKVLNTSTQENK